MLAQQPTTAAPAEHKALRLSWNPKFLSSLGVYFFLSLLWVSVQQQRPSLVLECLVVVILVERNFLVVVVVVAECRWNLTI